MSRLRKWMEINDRDYALRNADPDRVRHFMRPRQSPRLMPAQGGSSFAPADIVDESFETGDHHGVGFDDGGGNTAPTTPDNTRFAPGGGTWSLGYDAPTTPGGEAGAATYKVWSQSYNEIWAVFWFYLTSGNTSIQKFFRFYTNFESAGGIFMKNSDQLLCACFDQESQVDVPIGVDESNLNAWHYLGINYRKVGDPTPNMSFMLDGVPFTTPNASNVDGQGSSWINNRLVAGSRNNPNGLRYNEFLGTLNPGNTTPYIARLDRIRISSGGWPSPF